MSSFYSAEELLSIGFKHIGTGVRISRKASIYRPELISVGDKVRVDDFCILSGNIEIGNYVHIAAHVCLFGGVAGISIGDFAGVSSRCSVYAESDDYCGNYFTNPTLPNEYRNIVAGHVSIGKHSIIGSACTVLPGVALGEGCAVGSMSLVNRSMEEWSVCIGIPCRKIKDRERGVLQLEHEFMRRK